MLCRFFARAAFAASLAVAGVFAAPASSAERAMIVLDASGSMWGQIDGEAKITIARRVLGEVLGTLPQDIELGLMAYGHREKGQCSDIEILVPPGHGSVGAIAAAAEGLRPLGKTPLTESVRRAAEELKYTENKATVVLVTDGIETCQADPCALGRELERLGVGFTAHVVGFGLSAEEGRQVACLAEETGGLYLPAADAGGLGAALQEPFAEFAEAAEPDPVQPPPPAERPEASLVAPESIEIARTFDVTWEGPGEDRDTIELFDPAARNGEGVRIGARRLINGDFEAKSVTLTAPVRPGTYELRYSWQGDREKPLAVRTIEVVEAEVSLDAPANVSIGKDFTVSWQGPGATRDSIRIFDPAAKGGRGETLRSKRLIHGDVDNRQVTLTAPAEPGFYRLQYHNGDSGEVLAAREIEVLEAPVSLEAPDEVGIASSFAVKWEGPGAVRDAVEIYDPEAKGGRGERLATARIVNGDVDAQTVRLIAPAKPGAVQLRYWNGDSGLVLATRPITIVETEVALSAPDEVAMGTTFEVQWVGPGADRDAIEIYDPAAKGGRGERLASARIVNGDFDARTVKLIAPARPGEVQLRYWNGSSSVVLATRSLTVVAMEVSLSAPDTAPMAHVLKVGWVGPGADRDAIEIFDPEAKAGRGQILKSARVINGDIDARTVELVLPARPGSYLLRYWSGDSSTVLATRPIAVEPVDVSLDAPASVTAGELFDAGWVGPGAARDSIQIYDPAAKNGRGQVLASKRLINERYDEKTVSIEAPEAQGNYLLRYHNGDSDLVLAEQPIVVE
jgi:Ca-activated chloride channel family protein